MVWAGASTPYPYFAISDRSHCVCLPGYYAIRGADGLLVTCKACGFNFHRLVHMLHLLCVLMTQAWGAQKRVYERE